MNPEVTDAPRVPTLGITSRGIFVGALGALAIGVGAPYATMILRGTMMAADFTTAGAIFLLFVLVAGPNLLLHKIKPSLALTKSELITVYIMMVVASAIPTMGLTAQVLPLIVAPFYFATRENRWAELLQENIPSWAVPRGAETGAPLVTEFFQGFVPTEEIPHHTMPWGSWLPALAVWAALLLCLHFVMISMMVILRKQWADRERLAYPLTQLPLELCEDGGARLGKFLRNRNMRIGFAISMFVGCLVGLRHYHPFVPVISLSHTSQVASFSNATIYFHVSLAMLGFFYLVNTQTLFSLWFFNLLFFGAKGIMGTMGIELHESLGHFGTPSPVFAHLGMGAMIALVLAGLWIARRQLREGWYSQEDDPQEVLSYRVAWRGIIAGLVFIGIWLHLSGLPGAMVPVLLFAAFVLFIGLTRIVVESGLAEAVGSTIAPSFLVSGFGTAAIGAKGLAALGLAHVWCSDIRTFVMASCANSLKLAGVIKGPKRRLFGAMFLAIVIALLSSMWLTLKWAYAKGGITMSGWFFQNGPWAIYSWVAEKMANPTEPNVAGWVLTGIGAIVMVLLTVMHRRFVWWPFHPVGFCLGGIWMMDRLWFTAFVAWLVKSLTLRYGGMQVYRRARPAFLGLILGQFVCSGMWLAIDHHYGSAGHIIFSF